MSPPDPVTTNPVSDSACIEGGPLASRVARLLSEAFGASPSSIRVGVDACDIAALRRQLRLSSAPHFLANSFTQQELDYCAGRPERLAARWAAKEAVAKAVGTGFRGLGPNQIEIRRLGTGEPYVHSADGRPWPYDAHTWSWQVSLAHEADLAVAIAIAIPTSVTKAAVDPAGTTWRQP